MATYSTISVVGLGYVGMVQAACLADQGLNVLGVDRDPARLAAVGGAADCPFVEPGLPALVEQTAANGQLRPCDSVQHAVLHSDITILCVDTPRANDGSSDLRALIECIDAMASSLSSKPGEHALVVRSTIPVGTMRRHVLPRFAVENGRATENQVTCLFIPEFLREGSALRDYRHPEKLFVGCLADDDRARNIVGGLFRGTPAPRHFVSYEMAELAKYADNGWHALKVCFANEMAALSSAFGIDGQILMELFRQDRQLNISEAYLKPGMPFGGSCLTKDVSALQHMADEQGLALPLVGSVLASNDRHLERCANRVLDYEAKNIGIWGISYKPGTGDLRNSPALSLIERLLAEDRLLYLHDPEIPPKKLAEALGARDPAWRQALENCRIRIDGLNGLDSCEVIVLCHAPADQAVGRPGQHLVGLYI